MPNKELRCQTSVRIYGEEKCFGPGVAELLERVDQLRSLRKAFRYAARRKQPVLIKDGHRLIGHLSCNTP